VVGADELEGGAAGVVAVDDVDVVVEVPVDVAVVEELDDGSEVETGGVETADAAAAGSALEPEEPLPHEAHASAAKTPITVFTVFTTATSRYRSWHPIMHAACPQAEPCKSVAGASVRTRRVAAECTAPSRQGPASCTMSSRPDGKP
jgi:hypothetical protein